MVTSPPFRLVTKVKDEIVARVSVLQKRLHFGARVPEQKFHANGGVPCTTSRVSSRAFVTHAVEVTSRRTHDNHARVHVSEVEVEPVLLEAPFVLGHEASGHSEHATAGGKARRHGQQQRL